MNRRQRVITHRNKFRAPDVLRVDAAADSTTEVDVVARCAGRGIRITDINDKPISDGGSAVAITNGSVELVDGVLSLTPDVSYTGPVTFVVGLEDGTQRRFSQIVATVA